MCVVIIMIIMIMIDNSSNNTRSNDQRSPRYENSPEGRDVAHNLDLNLVLT